MIFTDENHMGTFCEDGMSTLPEGVHWRSDNPIFIIQYGLPGTGETALSFTAKPLNKVGYIVNPCGKEIVEEPSLTHIMVSWFHVHNGMTFCNASFHHKYYFRELAVKPVNRKCYPHTHASKAVLIHNESVTCVRQCSPGPQHCPFYSPQLSVTAGTDFPYVHITAVGDLLIMCLTDDLPAAELDTNIKNEYDTLPPNIQLVHGADFTLVSLIGSCHKYYFQLLNKVVFAYKYTTITPEDAVRRRTVTAIEIQADVAINMVIEVVYRQNFTRRMTMIRQSFTSGIDEVIVSDMFISLSPFNVTSKKVNFTMRFKDRTNYGIYFMGNSKIIATFTNVFTRKFHRLPGHMLQQKAHTKLQNQIDSSCNDDFFTQWGIQASHSIVGACIGIPYDFPTFHYNMSFRTRNSPGEKHKGQHYVIGYYNDTTSSYELLYPNIHRNHIYIKGSNTTGEDGRKLCASLGHGWNTIVIKGATSTGTPYVMEVLGSMVGSLKGMNTSNVFASVNPLDGLLIDFYPGKSFWNLYTVGQIKYKSRESFPSDYLDLMYRELIDYHASKLLSYPRSERKCGFLFSNNIFLQLQREWNHRGIKLLWIPCNGPIRDVAVLCEKLQYDKNDTSRSVTYPVINNYPTDKKLQQYSSKLFECSDRSHILEHHVCDGSADCLDGGDEQVCQHVCKPQHSQCLLCAPLYYRCQTVQACVPLSKICDCHDDCTDGSDEDQNLCAYKTCTEMGKFSFYRLKPAKVHLVKYDCMTHWYLPYKPQYPGSRMPLHVFCDGKKDCSDGTDEEYCTNLTIVPSLRCGKGSNFVRYDDIGNGIAECTGTFDDEILVMFNQMCLETSCTCHGFSVWCHNTTVLPELNKWTKSLLITNDDQMPGELNDALFENLMYLIIVEIHADILQLSHVFHNLPHLTILDLSQNKLSSIPSKVFEGLHVLTVLNLSHNAILILNGELTVHLQSLRIIDVSNNPYTKSMISELFLSSNNHLEAFHVVYKDMCCLKTNIDCFYNGNINDAPALCGTILAHLWSNIIIPFALVVVVVTNYSCFSLWINDGRKKWKAKHMLGCCLNIADALMSVYLVIIITADGVYHGNAGFVALHWNESWPCAVGGLICLLSVEMSTTMTLLIAIDRFVCIVVTPFHRQGFSLPITVLISSLMLIFTLVLLLLVFILAPPTYTTSICIPLGSSVSKLFSLLLLAYNLILFLTLCTLYTLLFVAIVKMSINKSLRKMQQMLMKLGGIFITNFFVWFCITVLSVMSVTGNSVKPSIETAVGITLLPVNALVNPLIYKPDTPDGLRKLSKYCISVSRSFMNVIRRKVMHFVFR